ncbi:MAG: VOC family protein [Acidobacteria bacterium]|nr:VOC family protein [Acidobacteriota bacterium]
MDRIVWVADDVDAALAGWRKLDLVDAKSPAGVDLRFRFRGKPARARVRWASGSFGDVAADWVQPVSGASAFDDHRRRHQRGLMALLHRAPDTTALEAEIARLGAAGVAVLQSGDLPEVAGGGRYVLFDTEREGKYTLGLITGGAPRRPTGRRLSQYAFVVRNLEAVSRYWAKLGFPEMPFTHPKLWDQRYRGQETDLDARFGWHRHGKVVYEWITPLKGPSVYLDHLEQYGEGPHHLGLQTADIDREIADWERRGSPVSQSGGWGVRGEKGSGRFAYLDTHGIAGVEMELLWSFR